MSSLVPSLRPLARGAKLVKMALKSFRPQVVCVPLPETVAMFRFNSAARFGQVFVQEINCRIFEGRENQQLAIRVSVFVRGRVLDFVPNMCFNRFEFAISFWCDGFDFIPRGG